MKLKLLQIPQFPNPTIPTAPKRILAVDDDPDLLSLYVLTLAGAGYKIETAVDGEQAWRAFSTTDYDLLLTDNNMPGCTGTELVARLRHAGMTQPVIIVSGFALGFDEDESEGLGLAAVLRKPFMPDELLAAVRQMLPPPQTASLFLQQQKARIPDLSSLPQPRFAGINE
jgi:DNA-binding response OmpR family regulator